jgi:hypothetical protein
MSCQLIRRHRWLGPIGPLYKFYLLCPHLCCNFTLRFFLGASTECTAGSNDHFVVGGGGGSIFCTVRWKATRWRLFSVLALRNHATWQPCNARNNHATLQATKQSRNLATQQSRNLATQQSRNLKRNNHATL